MVRGPDRAALWLLTSVMIVFIGALIYAERRGLDVSCGCFGHTSSPEGIVIPLTRDFLIIAALTLLLTKDRRIPSNSDVSP